MAEFRESKIDTILFGTAENDFFLDETENAQPVNLQSMMPFLLLFSMAQYSADHPDTEEDLSSSDNESEEDNVYSNDEDSAYGREDDEDLSIRLAL